MEFPQYRKYPNDKSFFEIQSETSFREIKLIGSAYTDELFEAKIFPDRILIQDMLSCENGTWEKISQDEFNSLLEDVKSNRRKL